MKLFRLLLPVLLMLAPLPALAQVTAPAPYLATALTATVQIVKASKGTLQWGQCYNPNPVAYVQVFDVSGSVTVGTTIPKLSLPLAATAVTPIPVNAQFVNAIKVAATTTPSGSSAPGSAVTCNFGFN